MNKPLNFILTGSVHPLDNPYDATDYPNYIRDRVLRDDLFEIIKMYDSLFLSYQKTGGCIQIWIKIWDKNYIELHQYYQ